MRPEHQPDLGSERPTYRSCRQTTLAHVLGTLDELPGHSLDLGPRRLRDWRWEGLNQLCGFSLLGPHPAVHPIPGQSDPVQEPAVFCNYQNFVVRQLPAVFMPGIRLHRVKRPVLLGPRGDFHEIYLEFQA